MEENLIAGLGDIDTPVTAEQIEGVIGRASLMAPAQVKKASQVMAKRMNSASRTVASNVTLTKDSTSKAELMSKMGSLPEEIRQGIANKTLQLVDTQLYATRALGTDASGELMLNSDVAEAGKTNVNHRKLEPNQYFILMGIQLLSGVNANVKATAFGAIPDVAANGDFQLDLGSKVIIPKSSANMFNTAGRTDLPVGYYKLENPKLIAPQTEIKPQLWCSGANAANTNYKIVLHGAILVRN